MGSTLFQHTIRDGSKVTTSGAYLAPNRNRTNLNIITRAKATRILFNGSNVRGVTFTRGGNQYTVQVRREVILSAGLYQKKNNFRGKNIFYINIS
jgi:choline dehydrogenase